MTTRKTFTGRHTIMGLVIFSLGLFIAPLVPLSFTLSKQAWLLGVLLFLPMSIYAVWEGARRLARVHLEISDEGIRRETRFSKQEMPWSDVAKIEVIVGSDDENRIILTLHGVSKNKLRIHQGPFSIWALDEIVGLLKAQASRHQHIEIREDFHGLWSAWDNLMEAHYKRYPKRRPARK